MQCVFARNFRVCHLILSAISGLRPNLDRGRRLITMGGFALSSPNIGSVGCADGIRGVMNGNVTPMMWCGILKSKAIIPTRAVVLWAFL
jgi:hypothetical protein